MHRLEKRKQVFFITAIGTDSGKTLASAILCEALEADYWKPIQAGYPRDSETVETLISNRKSTVHAETYLLQTPESPHAAAKRQGVTIDLNTITLPESENNLIVEGAGGLLVPVNDESLIADIPVRLGLPVILVSNFYLGSINHSLLTIEALKSRRLSLAGIIFNGIRNEESERIILQHANAPVLLHIEQEPAINPETVKKYARKLSFINTD